MKGAAIDKLETWLVGLIALHSLVVGVVLLFFTGWSLELGGWGKAAVPFFARQGGVFHIVVAAGYLFEYLRYRGVGLLLIAKSTATVFLLVEAWAPGAAWALPAAALGDAAMAAAVLLVHRRVLAVRS